MDQNALEEIVKSSQNVVLILGITVRTMYEGSIEGIRDRTTDLPESCDVVICHDRANKKNSFEKWGNRTLIGIGGYFNKIIQEHPYLVGCCDIILNDYSTSKFFPEHFPETLLQLLRTETGFALLQDLAQKPLIVPFRSEDMTFQTSDDNVACVYFIVVLMDGREIRLDGIYRFQKQFTVAQLLFRVQTLTRSVVSRDALMIYAGKLFSTDENLIDREPGTRFNLVRKMGLHFVEQYSTYFQVLQSYAPYPVKHSKKDTAADVWMLRQRAI